MVDTVTASKKRTKAAKMETARMRIPEFVLSGDIFGEVEDIKVSERDYNMIVEMLNNPQPLNEAMKKALSSELKRSYERGELSED